MTTALMLTMATQGMTPMVMMAIMVGWTMAAMVQLTMTTPNDGWIDYGNNGWTDYGNNGSTDYDYSNDGWTDYAANHDGWTEDGNDDWSDYAHHGWTDYDNGGWTDYGNDGWHCLGHGGWNYSDIIYDSDCEHDGSNAEHGQSWWQQGHTDQTNADEYNDFIEEEVEEEEPDLDGRGRLGPMEDWTQGLMGENKKGQKSTV